MSQPDRLRGAIAAIGQRLGQIDLPPGVRRAGRWAGYPAFGVCVALIAFASALPDEKVKERLETLLSQDPTPSQPMGIGADIKAGELSISLLRRGIVAKNVVLRTRPQRMTDKPSRYVLDEVDVSVGLFGLMFQRPTYSFSIDAFNGKIEGSARITTTANRYDIEASEVALGAVQGLQTALGPPLEGKLEGKLDLDAPGRLLANSNGSLEITVDQAALGDGKAKLVIPGDAFLSQGMTIPRVRLGKVVFTLNIEKGKARIDIAKASSPDGELTLEGHVDLRDPLPMSQLHLFLRFKLSEALLKREPSLEIITGSMAALGKRADGFIGAQITGSLASPIFLAAKTPPQGVISKAEGTPPPPTPPPPGPLPVGTPPPPIAVPPPPGAPADAAPAPPIDVPPPAQPQPQPKDGVIPPPPPLRGLGRTEIPHPEETGTPAPAPPPPAAPPPAPAPAPAE